MGQDGPEVAPRWVQGRYWEVLGGSWAAMAAPGGAKEGAQGAKKWPGIIDPPAGARQEPSS